MDLAAATGQLRRHLPRIKLVLRHVLTCIIIFDHCLRSDMSSPASSPLTIVCAATCPHLARDNVLSRAPDCERPTRQASSTCVFWSRRREWRCLREEAAAAIAAPPMPPQPLKSSACRRGQQSTTCASKVTSQSFQQAPCPFPPGSVFCSAQISAAGAIARAKSIAVASLLSRAVWQTNGGLAGPPTPRHAHAGVPSP